MFGWYWIVQFSRCLVSSSPAKTRKLEVQSQPILWTITPRLPIFSLRKHCYNYDSYTARAAMPKRKLTAGAATPPSQRYTNTSASNVSSPPSFNERPDLGSSNITTPTVQSMHIRNKSSGVTDQRTGFFDLPRELRDTIYGWVLTAMYDPEEHEGNPKDQPPEIEPYDKTTF